MALAPPISPGQPARVTPGQETAASPRPGRSSFWSRLALAVVAGLAGGGGALGIATAAGWGAGESTVVRVLPNTSDIATRPTGIQEILARVLPAVASIRAVVRQPDPYVPGLWSEVVKQGTGVVITASGDVVTNAHVVEGASSLSVTLDGSRSEHQARLLAIDVGADLAVLRVSGVGSLPTVRFADSGTTRVGDDVIAIGYALGLSGGPTVTDGIVSGTGRKVTTTREDGASVTLGDMLQTDAAINPGNSGGPLVNSSSRVVGINTAVASSSGSPAENVGFAIPAGTVERLIASWRQSGRL